jgi:hypothetical protein
VKVHELSGILSSAEWRKHLRIWGDPYLRRQIELAEQIRSMHVGGAGISCEPAPRSLAAQRRTMRDAYKAEILSKTGRKLTNADIWLAAHYTDKSVFYRWLAGKCDSEPIERVLREKPHLKPLSSHLP